MMKKFLASLTAFTLLMTISPDPQAFADENDDFFFDMESTLRTDASRHRYLVPLPGLNVRTRKKLMSPATLSIVIPPEMPAIFSSEMSQAQIQGTAIGKVNNPTKKSLSEDQKRLNITVTADLFENTSFLLVDVYMKVFDLNGSTYPLYLEYTDDEGETVQLSSSATIFLNRKEGQKRNDNPEPFREVVLMNNDPEIVQVKWTPSPDLDFYQYDLTIRDRETQRVILNDTIQSRESTSYSQGGLVKGKTYEVILKSVDTGFMESVYETSFVAGSLNDDSTEMPEPAPVQEQETLSPYRATESVLIQPEVNYTPTQAAVPGRFAEVNSNYNQPISRQFLCSECTAEAALQKIAERAAESFPDKVLDRSDVFETLNLEELQGVLARRTTRRLKSTERRLRRKRADGQLLNIDAVEILYAMARYERLRPQLRLLRPQYNTDMEVSERRVLRQLYELQRRGLLTSETSPLLSDPFEALTQEAWLDALTEFFELLETRGR